MYLRNLKYISSENEISLQFAASSFLLVFIKVLKNPRLRVSEIFEKYTFLYFLESQSLPFALFYSLYEVSKNTYILDFRKSLKIL